VQRVLRRTITEDLRVQDQRDSAEERWTGAELAWEAITWAISHDPAVGAFLPDGSRLRALKYDGARSIDQPDVTIIYEDLGHEIVIRDALFEDAKHAQVGHC